MIDQELFFKYSKILKFLTSKIKKFKLDINKCCNNFVFDSYLCYFPHFLNAKVLYRQFPCSS